MPGDLTPEQRYAEWVRYLEAAFKDIIHAFWNRKVFRAVGEMFDKNPQLRDGEGGETAWGWVVEVYAHYAVMLIRRELDTQSRVLNLTRMLFEMEKHHHVLVDHAKGGEVPSIDGVRADREYLQQQTEDVVDYGKRIIAHRTPAGAPDITLAQLDDALRALRKTLIRYNGVLKASHLLSTTPVPQFDWLAPYRVAWISEGFEEPEAEEDAQLSEEEKQARRGYRKTFGFSPS